MGPTRRAEIDAVFDGALDRDSAERAAWLDARCGEDRALRAEVDALLAAHERATGILDRGVGAFANAFVPPSRLLDGRIGPYRIVREIGRGGMGVVYLAERADGEFTRQVAIKLLHAGPDSVEMHRRFLAERQILATLEHPNIARLFDGGTTDDGVPYLVMEHVDGEPITAWCDRRRLDVAARLRLFGDVCRAVHAAHQRLVIHRDLKPSNILVTSDGEVKLLDFGIARVMATVTGEFPVHQPGAPDLSTVPPLTRTGFRPMTPEYASPEQVRGDVLTTASDVYALGVVLYELLAGRRPYRIRTGAPRELQEMICEREPERPSSVVRRQRVRLEPADGHDVPVPTEVAAARAVSPERLRRQLRGDVDAIVMMALRKEPQRRYGSAERLAEDVQRHLDGLPVAAHRGSAAYRLRKLVSRHRVVVTAFALVAVSLAGGVVAAAFQARVAARERDRAEQALQRAEQALRESGETTDFLVGLFDIQQGATPIGAGATRGTTDDLLRRGAAQVEQLSRQPLVQARMLDVMGRVYRSQARLGEARTALARSLALRRLHGDIGTAAAATMVQLADVLRRQGRYAEAESTSRAALALRTQLLGPRHPEVADVQSLLSSLAIYRGDLARAESLAREALAIDRAAFDDDDTRVARRLELFAATLRRRGATADAERAYEEAIGIRDRTPGDEPALAQALLRLGDLYATNDRHADAERLYDRAVGILRGTLGDDHPQLGFAYASYCTMRSSEGRHADAERLCRAAADIARRALGADHPGSAEAQSHLAAVLRVAGRYDEAERAQGEALRIVLATYGREHTQTAGTLAGMADILLARGQLDSAEALQREVIAIRRRALGPESNVVGLAMAALGDTRARRGDLAGADSLYREGARILVASSSPTHGDVRNVYGRLAKLHAAHGRHEEAARWRALADVATPPAPR